MTYGQIVKDSINYAIKYPWLWLFGFFISLGEISSSFKDIDSLDRVIDISPIFMILLGLGALIVAIIYIVLSLIAECSLIVAIRDLQNKVETGFVKVLKEGIQYFWRILGIVVTAIMLVIATILGFAILIVPAFLIHKVLGILVTILLIPLLIVIIAASIVFFAYAYRAAIIDNLIYSKSLSKAWNLLKGNLAESAILAIISFVAQCLIAIVVLLIAVFTVLPFIAAGTVNFWLGLIPGVLVFFVLFVIIGGITGVYSSSFWTLAYLELSDKQKVEIEVEENIA